MVGVTICQNLCYHCETVSLAVQPQEVKRVVSQAITSARGPALHSYGAHHSCATPGLGRTKGPGPATRSYGGSRGVRIQGVEVPGEVKAGEDVSLKCWVDPWPGPLYSLSWWKDGSQFYRAAVTASPISRDKPPSSGSLATVFPVPGISVKAGGRGLGHVVLEEVGVAASGVYTCEAVADFPSFSQQLVSANLTVVGKTREDLS
ncbi:hypothetical protein E2C01_028326 [Portunus trituberculatus]|uniref:Ig-like domain-containing protein n=1 Tax=Portunus trituberculatus TaxID=210409 RepID=A0A5B7EKC7_PORTR|nr:hypothetical protein [Portunus trituberculatus]